MQFPFTAGPMLPVIATAGGFLKKVPCIWLFWTLSIVRIDPALDFQTPTASGQVVGDGVWACAVVAENNKTFAMTVPIKTFPMADVLVIFLALSVCTQVCDRELVLIDHKSVTPD